MCKMWFEKWLDQALLVGAILFAATSLSLAQADSAKAPSAPTPALLPSHAETPAADEYFVIEARHKVFTGFLQIDTVRMNQRFPIGEGDEEGMVFLFNPHLAITDSGRVLQMSDTLYNPAARVRVLVGDSVIQESWAFFFIDAPHFRRADLLGFRLIDFKVADRFVRVEKTRPAMAPAPADSTAKPH